MNPQAIQTALARVAALKDALGAAASKAGSFAKSELAGTLANLSPAAVGARYKAVDAAQAETNDAAARNAGWPGGVAQYEQEFGSKNPLPDSTNMLGDFAHGIVNAYRSIKKKF
jgi:hypothetical protein